MPDVEQQINGSGFLRLSEPEPCFACTDPTKLLSLAFEAPAHAGCAELAWTIVLRGGTDDQQG